MTDRTIDLQLTGMTCAACAARIEKVLNRAEGVRAAVNFATETARVEFDAGKATPQSVIALVRKAGYDAAPAVDPFAMPEHEARKEARRYRRDLSTFALAALLTAPLVAQMAFMVTGEHDGRLCFQHRCLADSDPRPACVFRGGERRHHAGAPRQAARRAGEGEDRQRNPPLAQTAAADGAARTRRRSA